MRHASFAPMLSPLSWAVYGRQVWTNAAQPHGGLYRRCCHRSLTKNERAAASRNRNCVVHTNHASTLANLPEILKNTFLGLISVRNGFTIAQHLSLSLLLRVSLPTPPTHPPQQASNRYSPLGACPVLSKCPSHLCLRSCRHRKKDGALYHGVPPTGGH